MTNGEKIQTILDIDKDCTEVYGKNGMMTFSVPQDWWNAEYKEPTTKNDLAVDCIVDVLGSYTDLDIPYKREIAENILTKLPSVTPREPITWIVGKNNAQIAVKNMPVDKLQKICAIISDEQEPVLEKINKIKSEIADSLEFWDYSPNNNPLARDMLETLTNFWGDLRGEEV